LLLVAAVLMWISSWEFDRSSVSAGVGVLADYLKSEDEGPPLAELASLLQAVWDEAQKYASDPAFPTDEEFQQAPSWPKVVDSARRAHDALLP